MVYNIGACLICPSDMTTPLKQFIGHLQYLMNIKSKHDQNIKIKRLAIDVPPVMRQIIAMIF